MTTPVQQSALVGYFSWKALDALAASAWRAVEAVFRLGIVWPTRSEWREALTASIVRQIVLAEVTGRYAGVPARPLDGNPVLPNDDVPRRRPEREFEQLAAEAPPLSREERENPYDVPLRDDELTERIGVHCALCVQYEYKLLQEQFERGHAVGQRGFNQGRVSGVRGG